MPRELRVSGCVELSLPSTREAEALAQALRVEAENPPDAERGTARVEVAGSRVAVCFDARDPSSARALLNAFLSLAAATIEALRRLEHGSQAGAKDGPAAPTRA